MGGLGERLLRKARGIVGLGLVGAGLGLLGGGVWGLITTLLDVGLFLDAGYWSLLLTRITSTATYFALPAAFTTTSFGLLLAAADGKRALVDLPLWRMALFGALGGALFFPAILFARFGMTVFGNFPISSLPLMGVLASLGGLLTLSLTALAKKAHHAELDVVRDVERLSQPE